MGELKSSLMHFNMDMGNYNWVFNVRHQFIGSRPLVYHDKYDHFFHVIKEGQEKGFLNNVQIMISINEQFERRYSNSNNSISFDFENYVR